jgi:hypothetical protein
VLTALAIASASSVAASASPPEHRVTTAAQNARYRTFTRVPHDAAHIGISAPRCDAIEPWYRTPIRASHRRDYPAAQMGRYRAGAPISMSPL